MADESLYRTPDEYVLKAIERIQSSGSRITDFNVGSVARNMQEGHAAITSEHSAVIEQLRLDSYLATATGDALDRKAADQGVERVAAVAAAGTIRLTRQATGSAVTVPAGWGSLLTPPVPNAQPVAFITTEDAVFGTGDLFKVVAGSAVEGGSEGNIAINTNLLPTNAVTGFTTDGGFKAEIAFTGGVDEETDDELRARVPIEVAGRVKGRREAFLAAALRVAGVESAAVLAAGETRAAGGTVPIGQVEVYYEGLTSLQAQVTSECEAASTAGQTVVVDDATVLDVIADLTVTCKLGTDTVALAVAVKDAVMAAVNATGVGEIAYASNVVKAAHDVALVVGVTVPFTDLRLSTAGDNTFGNVTPGAERCLRLTLANTAVTVNAI